MIKMIDSKGKESKEMLVKDMPVGETGIVIGIPYNGEILYRASYERLVSLSEKDSTWRDASENTIQVRLVDVEMRVIEKS